MFEAEKLELDLLIQAWVPDVSRHRMRTKLSALLRKYEELFSLKGDGKVLVGILTDRCMAVLSDADDEHRRAFAEEIEAGLVDWLGMERPV